MKIIFRANGRCASAAVEPTGQPVTAGSRGIVTEFELSEDYAGLVVYAVFRSQSAQGEQILTENYDPVEVPWEVLEKPSLTFDIGVVGKNGEGSVVIPTIWARVGRIVTAARGTWMGPDDPSADIGTQIVEQARAAAQRAEQAADQAAEAKDDAEAAKAASEAAQTAAADSATAAAGSAEDADTAKTDAEAAKTEAQRAASAAADSSNAAATSAALATSVVNLTDKDDENKLYAMAWSVENGFPVLTLTERT